MGFGDRLFVTVMITFGLGFLWLGWLERYVSIWIVPILGLVIGFFLIRGWRLESKKGNNQG